jgi:hypothetical protein
VHRLREVHWADIALLAVVAALPLLSLAPTPWALLADPYSEVPVKLWVFETFAHAGIFGGVVDSAGWPNVGSLNNADPVGTVVTALLRPLMGRYWAYNDLVVLQLFASLVAMRALLRTLVASRAAALYGALAFVFTPIVLTYCVTGAVTDMLNLWPYALAVRSGLKALRTGFKDGVYAGIFVGVGFVTCPYNVVVFSILAVPLLPFITLLRGATPWPRVGAALLGVTLGAAAVAGPYAVQMRSITAASDSQMSDAMIADTRHAAPYPFLKPEHPDRYTAFLSDYVAVGKSQLIEREAGSRYYRAFSPGLGLIALALLGLVLAGRPKLRGLWSPSLLWCTAAGFCALASLGPFTPITAQLYSNAPTNTVWLFLQRFWPGSALILEPFRYAIPATFALAIAGAYGVEALEQRVGLRARRWIGAAAIGLWLVELIALSPVPIPLPIAALQPSPASRLLAAEATASDGSPGSAPASDTLPGSALPGGTGIAPGAVIFLPWFNEESDRFNRVHFLDQLALHRPIADEVIGFPARYLRENNYTAALLAAEKPNGRLRTEPRDRSKIDGDRAKLAKDGFAAIVLNRAHFRDAHRYDAVRALLVPLGTPTVIGTEEIFVLPTP